MYLLINSNYMENEENLLKKARLWFNLNYGKTAEQAGYHCVKLWYKPMLMFDFKIHRFPEVVFGPEEKEVDAFIKGQSTIRWGIIVFLIFMLLGIPILFSFVVTQNTGLFVFGTCGGLIAFLACVAMIFYITPLEKIYKDKIITYMEKNQ